MFKSEPEIQPSSCGASGNRATKNEHAPQIAPLGPNRPICNARLKSGPAQRCRRPPAPGRKRCHLHGGLSSGPATREGLERTLTALYKGKQNWLKQRRQAGLPLPGRPKGAKNLATRAYEKAVAEYPAVLAAHEQARREAAEAAYEATLEKLRGERIRQGLKLAGARIKREDAYRAYPPPPAPPRFKDFKAPKRRYRAALPFRPSMAVKTAPVPALLTPPEPPARPPGRPLGDGWRVRPGHPLLVAPCPAWTPPGGPCNGQGAGLAEGR